MYTHVVSIVSLIVRTLTYVSFIGCIITSLVSAISSWNNNGALLHLPMVIIAILSIIEAPLFIFGVHDCFIDSKQLLIRRPRRYVHLHLYNQRSVGDDVI
jgi:phosphotransferase system  glucose/maltose/N-acetylglucosamine-specific IIC component